MFAVPLNSLTLRALDAQPRRLAELRQSVGGPAQTTLRAYLAGLIEVGAVAKVERGSMPYAVSHELTSAGEELLFVIDVLQAWLARSPLGEIKLGTESAKAAIKALTDGWDAAILPALASQPRSLTELDTLIADVSYPALERRLSSMRITGQVEAVPGEGNGTPYGVTDWARQGIAPLAAAGRWERLHMPDLTEPIGWVEVEAAFQLMMELVELPADASGECVLAVDTKGEERRIAGVHINVERGEILSCEPELRSEPPTFALGNAAAWLEAIIAGQMDRLHIGGDRRLAGRMVYGIHRALFGVA